MSDPAPHLSRREHLGLDLSLGSDGDDPPLHLDPGASVVPPGVVGEDDASAGDEPGVPVTPPDPPAPTTTGSLPPSDAAAKCLWA
jgi:hypothetical protein